MSQNTVPLLVRLYAEANESLLPGHTAPGLMQGFPAAPEQLVTWENWMRPPFNRWGFRHLARLRPSIDVRAGNAPRGPLNDAPQALSELRFDSCCGLSVSVLDHLVASHTDSFLVMQGDQVLFERYFNGQRPEHRHIMFSVTKSLIGLLGEQLISEALLDPMRSVSAYVPELAGSAFGDARVGRLLANDGWHAGSPLISSEAIARIAKGGDPAIYAANAEFSEWTPGASYRSQWYVFNDHSQALMAGGIHGQYLFIDKPSKVVIVKQSSLPEAVGPFDAYSVRMLRAIAAHLTH